jgi:dTDP-4-dehydrorhamnose reductase
MRSMVIGARGFLGATIADELCSNGCVDATTSDGRDGTTSLDVRDADAVVAAVCASGGDVVVFAAALADVERCEAEPAASHAVNALAPAAAARACAITGARLVLLSTDYVFDGRGGPYAEDDAPGPQNVYGVHKLAGERACAAICSRTLVVRLAHVYGRRPDGRGLVDALVAAERDGGPLFVDDVRITTPVLVDDAASAIGELIRRDVGGLIHIGGPDAMTRRALAQALCRALGLDTDILARAEDATNPAARRPARCGLRAGVLRKLGIQPRPVDDGARALLATLTRSA